MVVKISWNFQWKEDYTMQDKKLGNFQQFEGTQKWQGVFNHSGSSNIFDFLIQKFTPFSKEKTQIFEKKNFFGKLFSELNFLIIFLKKKLEFGDKLDFQQHCTRHLKNDLDQLGYFEVNLIE